MKPEPSNHLQLEADESIPHAHNLLKIVLIPTSHIYLDLPISIRVQLFC